MKTYRNMNIVPRVKNLGVTLALLAFATKLLAGDHWLSRDEGDAGPAIGAMLKSLTPPAVASSKVIDLVITLTNSPTGAQRTPYESVIRQFARAVYEESNAAHKLGRVSVYTGGNYADKCDILWKASGWPCANPAGRGIPGQHIYMFSNFNGTDFLTRTEDGGNCLAHEWGHYFYGLYDEYRGGTASYNTYMYMPHTTDDGVNVAIMNNQWNAAGGHYDWLNFSTSTRADYNNNNAQFRVYNAACWQTLIRPTKDDPRDGARKSLAARTYYPELAAAAPTGNSHLINLPNTDATNALNIVWMSTNLVMEIVLDRSGSMSSSSKMQNAITAARLLVDQAEIGSTSIGVVIFDDVVEVLTSVTPIDSTATKESIKAAIGTAYARYNTDIGAAATMALSEVTTAASATESKVVFLLTDGVNTAGAGALTAIPAYQSAKVPLFTFAYGSDADQVTLRKMADDTGGKFFYSPLTASEIAQAFISANQQVSQSQGLISTSATISGGNMQAIPIQVDSTLSRLDLLITYVGQASDANIQLVSPSGASLSPTATTVSGSETLVSFTVDKPLPGGWSVVCHAVSKQLVFSVQANGLPIGQLTYALSLANLTGSSLVQHPEPIVLLATLQKGLPIAGANVSATLKKPNGTIVAITLRDDGIAPDVKAGDGSYSSILDSDMNGIYEITVAMDNSHGTAKFSYSGLQPSVAADGSSNVPTDSAVNEGFSRSAKLQLTVQGVLSDDYGNTPAAAATLTADNQKLAGKIDYAGDVDAFAISVPTGSNSIAVRVSDFALGMDPSLTVLASDRSTVLAEGTLSTAASGRGYLYLVATNVQGVVYALVKHKSASGTGYYSVSAGVPLVSDANLALVTVPSASVNSLGAYVQLCVTAAGAEPLTYQWFKGGQALADGGLISGANSSCLTIGAVMDSADYTIVVANPNVSITSPAIRVDVSPPVTVVSVPKGTFNGLFYPLNAATTADSGSFTLTPSTKRFSGSLRFASKRVSIIGQFDARGHARVTPRLPGTRNVLVVDLQYDTTPGSERIVGTVSDGSYLAGIYAYLGAKGPQAPSSGQKRYTLAMPPAADASEAPGGWGAMTGTLSSRGNVVLAGTLGDGAKISQSLITSRAGNYPVFSPLYSGSGKGMIIGWVQFASDQPGGAAVSWIKPPGKGLYPNGFSLTTSMMGDVYQNPARGSQALVLNPGSQIILEGGGLSAPLVADITLVKNKAVIASNPNKITLTFNPSTGTFQGSFVPPGSWKRVSLSGIAVQPQNQALGLFLGSSQSGSVRIE